VGKKARIKGFRPGKTPRHILETYYREDAEGEAVSNLVQRSFEAAIEANNLMPVARPQIEQNGIQTDKSFTYSATVEVEPVIEPQGYTGLELQKEDKAVTDRDVDVRLEELRNMYSSLKDVEADRAVQEGDFLLIDFEGKLGGESRKELTETGFRIEVGSKRLVPGFEDSLIGLKQGESKGFTVKFPDDYPVKEFAGKDIVFHATVKDIKVKVLPELDENFVKNFEKYETMEALRTELLKSLEEEKSARVKANLQKAINEQLLEKNPFEVPEAYVERQIINMMVEYQRRMVMNGMDSDNAAKVAANLHDKFRDEAARMVRTGFLLQRIAEKESIAVDEKEIDDRIRETAARYGHDFESMKLSYEKDNMIDRLRDQILEEKTLDFIESRANIK
jgi:trigger factor